MTKLRLLALNFGLLQCGGTIAPSDGGLDALSGYDAPTESGGHCTPYVRPPTDPQSSPASCDGGCPVIITVNSSGGGYDLCSFDCATKACPSGSTCAQVGPLISKEVCYPSCDDTTPCPAPLTCSAGSGTRACK